MKRLWIRLSLSFSLVLLLGYITVAIAGILITRRDVFTYVLVNELESEGGLIDLLEQYYRDNSSWDGVESLLTIASSRLPRNMQGGGLSLAFTNEGGTLLFDSNERFGFRRPTDAQEEQVASLPVTIDERTRGYIVIKRLLPNVPAPDEAAPFFVRELSSFLLVLAVSGGVIGVVAGIIMSRSLTAPLDQLAQLTREFGAGRRDKRAKLVGSQEIVAVASAFNEMADSLERAETLRRNLIADVAHELRTPLTVLQANLQAILDGVYPLEITEIQGLMNQTEHLHRLVNDLRELAAAEAQQLPLNLQPINVNDIARDVVTKFRAIAETQGLTLKAELAPELPPVLGDTNRLLQVMNNLLHNALTHTSSGGSIVVSTAQQESEICITVSDTGSGIPPDALPHIFERFYRVDPSRSRYTGGVGLGLAIAKVLVELHKGHLLVVSVGMPGRGTTFTIKLPINTQ